MSISLEDDRREYGKDKLEITNLPKNPEHLLEKWLQEAKLNILDATAMTLATVNDNKPTQRTVLLKEIIEDNLIFYTNINSNKAQQIQHNNKVSLHFLWQKLEKQISICGTAKLLSREKVQKYFQSRPRASQIAAIISPQSKIIESRDYLLNKYQKKIAETQDDNLTAPEYWGGYQVQPESFEFWQGREYRLHDRFRYFKKNQQWVIQRLAP